MSKKQNIMEINGRRYDAHSGKPLDGQGHQPAKPKLITVQHVSGPRHQTSRRQARHVAHHKQQRSATLIRRAVRKPAASLKRHVRAQSHIGALVENPETLIHSPLFSAPDSHRLHRAEQIKRSRLIMHFNPHQPDDRSSVKVPVTIDQPAKRSAAPQKKAKTVPRQQAPDIDDIFDHAIQNATSHLEPSPKKARKHRLHLTRKHARA